MIIGLAGGQGTGKTTITTIISLILKKYFKLKFLKFLLMIFIKPEKIEKNYQSQKSFIMTRGVPGTHDYKIIYECFKKIKIKNLKITKI